MFFALASPDWLLHINSNVIFSEKSSLITTHRTPPVPPGLRVLVPWEIIFLNLLMCLLSALLPLPPTAHQQSESTLWAGMTCYFQSLQYYPTQSKYSTHAY